MKWMSLLADAGTKAFNAATAEIGAYFKRQRLFQLQFLFPTVAFLAGCLGVVMAITGPDLVRAWWGDLPLDLKLLCAALAAVLFLLTLQTSSSLLVQVRSLYSQGWPRWGWWQQWLRQPFLQARLAHDREQQLLARAWSELFQARAILDGLRSALPTPGEVPAPKRSYPVPRADLSAYQLIAGDDWEWKELEEVKDPAILTPGDLVGRYALRALPAGRAVARDAVRAIPDLAYLDPARRRILALSVYHSETGPALEAGAVVALWLTRREGWAQPRAFDDLLVLDRPSPGEIVLSVPEADLPAILTLLPVSRVTLVRSAEPPQPKQLAVPVVKPQDGLKPGQRIGREHIHWRTPKEGEDLSGVPGDEEAIVDHVYWPPNVFTCFPDQPETVLAWDAPFKADRLVAVKRPDWLTYVDPLTGKPRSRLAYRLPLAPPPGRGPVVQWYDAAQAQNVALNLRAVALPIREGDRVTVAIDGVIRQRRCYVFEVDRVQGCATIAVQDREEFHAQVQQARTIVLSPLCDVPALRVQREPGQLISDQQVVGLNRYANSADLEGACLSPDEVVDHYVCGPAAVLAGQPIPRSSLGRALPGGWKRLELTPTAGRMEITCESGTLVDLSLSGAGRPAGPWPAVVARAEPEGGGPIRAIDLFLPGASRVDLRRARRLWKRGAMATLAVRGRAEPTGRPLRLDLARQPAKRPGAIEVAGIERGVCATVDIQATATPAGALPASLPWSKALVSDYSHPFDRLVVAAPAEVRRQALNLWQQGAVARITVTHSDAGVGYALSELEREVRRAERLDPINRLLSAVDPDEQRLQRRAEELKAHAQRLAELRTWLTDRPWQQDSQPQARFAVEAEERLQRLVWRLAGAVELWFGAVDRVKAERNRAAELALPGELAQTCPTELGNVLAAAADHVQTAYRIDVVSVLPRLLAALGEADEEVVRLANAEEGMNTLLLLSFWSAVWAILGSAALLAFRGPWWALPAVLLGGTFLWWAAREAAVARAYGYGDALKMLFDLKRRTLLQAMGFDLGEAMTPQAEWSLWERLSLLFAHGTVAADLPPTKVGSGTAKKAGG